MASSDGRDALAGLLTRARETLTSKPVDRAASTLLQDFCACTLAGRRRFPSATWIDDGAAGRAALMAMRSHADDRDDVIWGAQVHPGSVIWPVTLALCATGRMAINAAALGYEVMSLAATVLRNASPAWHVTAIAGHLGAAAAAAEVLRLDDGCSIAALGLALTTAGGLGATVAARSNAAGWHRASAAVGGLQAARAATQGVRAPADLLERALGAQEIFAGTNTVDLDSANETPAIARTAIRLYPTNGFVHAAVEAAVEGSRGRTGVPLAVDVHVSRPFAAALAVLPVSRWWDGRLAVAATLLTGNPWTIGEWPASDDPQLLELRDHVRVFGDGEDPYGATVSVDGVSHRVREPRGLGLNVRSPEVIHKHEQLGTADGAAHVAGEIDSGNVGILARLIA
jgi:hypothetical protein